MSKARIFAEFADLQKRYPNGTILRERNLLNADGSRAIDPRTRMGRRLDIVVIENRQVRDIVEVTGYNVNKRIQLAREGRIRAAGGNFVRDPMTGQLFDLGTLPSRVSRRT